MEKVELTNDELNLLKGLNTDLINRLKGRGFNRNESLEIINEKLEKLINSNN